MAAGPIKAGLRLGTSICEGAPLSEEEDFKRTIAALRIEEAARRAHEKTGSAACPFCGNTEWLTESGGNLAAEDGTAPVFVPKDIRAYFGPAPSIPSVALSCSNCGFIRLHNIAVLNDGQ